MTQKPVFLDYVKKAFFQHWNLLVFGGSVVAGFISGRPDIVLPFVVSGELVYLTGLASHPKFRAYVDAQAHKEAKAQAEGPALQRIFSMLNPKGRARFEELRLRFRNLRALAAGIRQPDPSDVENWHMEGVNKLLWVFLKLLYSKQSLERFLAETDARQIEAMIKNLEGKIAKLGAVTEDDPVRGKMRNTLEDTLRSAKLRLENLEKARQNYEFILLELDRIDSKITSIAEIAVNRQDPGFIASEVDGVTATMDQTEKAMSELQFLSGLGEADAVPPSFIDEKLEIQ